MRAATLKAWMLTLVILHSSGASSIDIRVAINVADVIIIGTVTDLEEGASTVVYADGRVKKFDIASVTVDKYIKGTGPQVIKVVISPSDLAIGNNIRRRGERPEFNVDKSGLGLWLLQTRDNDKRFSTNVVSRRSEMFWSSEVGEYAPLALNVGHWNTIIPITSGKFTESASPQLCIADLFVRNAGLSSERFSFYMQRVWSLALEYPYHVNFPDEGLYPGEDRKLFRSWIDNVYPTIINPKSDSERREFLALRMQWSEESGTEFQDEWMILTRALGWEQHLIAPVLSKFDYTLEIAENAEQEWARGHISTMALCPKNERRRILQVVKNRLVETKRLDFAILECVYGLYEKPELDPWKKGNNAFENDISTQLAALKDLIKEELGG